MTLYTFQAGKGINANKINSNFTEVKDQANTNENNINTIANTALLKNGSNMSPGMAINFNRMPTNEIFAGPGQEIYLQDNRVYSINLNGNGAFITLPGVTPGDKSHTIIAMIRSNGYSLDYLGTTYHLLNDLNVDTTGSYSVMYIFNKLDNHWYYSLTK